MKNQIKRGIHLLFVGLLVFMVTVNGSVIMAANKNEVFTSEDTLQSGAKLSVADNDHYMKVGLQGNSYGIKLEKVPASMFSAEGTLTLSLWDDEDHLLHGRFDVKKLHLKVVQGSSEVKSNYKVETDGTLQLYAELIDQQQTVTIMLEGLTLGIDRTCPESHYKLVVGKKNNINQDEKLIFEHALIVSTPNTGTLPYVRFIIGEKKYSTNIDMHWLDLTLETDCAAYRNQQEIVMVPLKYAFHEKLTDIVSSKGVTWFSYYGRRMKINLNSNIVVVEMLNEKNKDKNIVRYTLKAKPEIKNGRIFMAVEDIAMLYGHGWSVYEDKDNVNKITIYGMC